MSAGAAAQDVPLQTAGEPTQDALEGTPEVRD